MKLSFLKLLVAALTVSLHYTAQADNRIDPTIEYGATVFNERCSLCHGNVGMGEGLLPQLIKDYPNTNLCTNKDATDPASIREAIIIYGGEKGLLDERMPPYGDELTWLEIESLVVFMRLYYRNVDKAVGLLTRKNLKNLRVKKVGPFTRGAVFYAMDQMAMVRAGWPKS